MNDMASAIAPKSDQINADDLIGGDMVITITGVKVSPGQEQPVSIEFEGSKKVFRPCKSMSRVLVAAWGPDTSRYLGRSIKLYRDPDVTWAGLKVGGIRIREMTDLDGGRALTIALTEKKGSRKPAVIKPLSVEKRADQPAEQKAGGEPETPPAWKLEALGLARKNARLGTAIFRAWWNSDEGKLARRDGAAEILGELQKLCAEADKAIDEDPFGLPPLPGATSDPDDAAPSDPTPEQIAAAMADAEAAARSEPEREA